MGNWTDGRTKLWIVPELDHLEVFRANAILHSYARHSHPSYSIGIIEAGVGGNCYRGTTYLAPPQSIIFMNPEEAHTGYSAEERPLTYRMLYPSIDLVQQIANAGQMGGVPYFRDAVVQNKVLARTILSLHAVLERSEDRLEQQSRLIDVMSMVLLYYAGTPLRSLQLPKEHQAVRLVKAYLHDHFNANISLEQLATIANLNRFYLIRIFRQAVGMPPYTYLNQIRVEKAKQFLRQGMSIADTAIAVGMSDQSHLTRHFKRILGITPSSYRNMSISFKTDSP